MVISKRNKIGLHEMGLMLVSFTAYLATFLLCDVLCDFLPHSFKYDGWIFLIFLPAGSKLFLILLFGIWGTIGDILALTLMASQIFSNEPPWLWIVYGITSGLSSYYGIQWVKKLLGIGDSLDELHFIHIPIIAVMGNLIHGFISIALLIQLNVVQVDRFWSNSFAMILGDFIGSFIVICVFWTGLRFYRLTFIKTS